MAVYKIYGCSNCGYEYNFLNGDPEGGIIPGTEFENLPNDWKCPVCEYEKNTFEEIDTIEIPDSFDYNYYLIIRYKRTLYNNKDVHPFDFIVKNNNEDILNFFNFTINGSYKDLVQGIEYKISNVTITNTETNDIKELVFTISTIYDYDSINCSISSIDTNDKIINKYKNIFEINSYALFNPKNDITINKNSSKKIDISTNTNIFLTYINYNILIKLNDLYGGKILKDNSNFLPKTNNEINDNIYIKYYQNIKLTATPNEGYLFEYWKIDDEKISNSTIQTISNTTYDKKYEAIFTKKEDLPTFLIKTNYNDTEGTAIIKYENTESTSCQITKYDSFTLIATPNEGYEFEGWYLNENLESDNINYTVYNTISESTYTAKFKEKEKTYTVNIFVPIQSKFITIYVNGQYIQQSKTITDIKAGEKITLFVHVQQDLINDYKFNYWKIENLDDETIVEVTDTKYYLNVENNYNIVANFSNDYIHNPIISTNINPENVGIVTIKYDEQNYSDNEIQITNGDTVQLAATPNEGYEFVNWTSQNGSSINNPITISNIKQDLTYTANFELKKYIVTCITNDSNAGTISCNKRNPSHGDTVKLTATPNEGYEFVNWSVNGENVSTENPYTTTINENTEFVANFKLKQYTVTCITNDSNAGTVSCSNDTPLYGEDVKLTATPNEGYNFLGWKLNNNDIVSYNQIYIFKITADLNYTAIFSKDTSYYEININTNTIRGIDTSNWINIKNDNNIKIAIGIGKYNIQKDSEIYFCDEISEPYNLLFKFKHWHIYDAINNIYIYNNPYKDIVDKDKTIIAKFIKVLYNVKLNQTNGGYITCDSNNISHNKTIILNATPNDGYKFVQWKLNTKIISDSQNCQNYQFKLTNNNISEYIKNTDDEFKFEAVFEPITYTITLNTNNLDENGKLKGVINMYYNDENKESIIENLRYNEKIKLEAIANKGYVFKHWNLNGNKYLSNNTIEFLINENCIFEPIFEKIIYKITIDIYPKNVGIISDIKHNYEYGEHITLIANAYEGYKFKNWIIDGKNESSNNIYTYIPEFEYSKNIKIVANFQKTIFEDKLKLIKKLLENKIEASIILLDKSLLYDYIDSPNNKSNEIYYIKDDNTSNYVVRYDGKIKPTFVDNRNTIFYKDYIDENELGTSIYAKYGKLKYEPLYPSIDYCAIKKSSNIDYTYLPEDIYNNDYEYSWFNNSKCLMLNPKITFKYNTKYDGGIKKLDEIIVDKLKEYYNIEDNDITKLNYIKNLYEYTNNLEYYSNDDINDYIYNITLTLKCK